MKRKLLVGLLAVAMLGNAMSVFATEEAGTETPEILMVDGDPDFSQLSIEEWTNYEFNRDYTTVIADVASYSHEFLREFLDSHWSTYLALSNPETRTVTDEEAKAMLITHHNLREAAIAEADAESNRIYLWPKGQVPSVTEYTENTGYMYADWPEFEPYMMEMLLDEGVEAKGAVILAAGGSHIFRSNVEETYEVALALNERGYQCFIVNYRVDPYTLDESGLDVARAVRYVRANAESYGIEEDEIACAGFSAGGSVISNTLDKYTGDVNASVLVDGYTPDELDAVSADVNAYLSVYANYGAESMNIETAPPTFFIIGGADGWESVSECFDAVRDSGKFTEIHTFAGVPHGFGAGTHADGTVYENAATWTILADSFMQEVYAQADAAEIAAE